MRLRSKANAVMAATVLSLTVVTFMFSRIILLDVLDNPGGQLVGEDLRRALNNLIFSFLLSSLVAGVFILVLLDKLIFSRLSILDSDVARIGSSSDFSLRVPVTSSDELSSLAISINRMMASLESAHIELRRYSENLEELVQERTARLRKSERLATIGETTAMVGHDLRNPLQVVTNNVYLLSKVLAESDDSRVAAESQQLVKKLQAIDSQVQYMNNVVSDLQDYSRDLKPTRVETSVRGLLDDSLSTIAFPPDVEARISVEDEASKVIVDPIMMKRVLVNLVSNAVQAMPMGGRLSLRVTRGNDITQIHVEDTGKGMTQDVATKIFQPLFTTKAKGTGLGLAVCKRLIEAHGGDITVESQAGKGSIFTIRLPDIEASDQAQKVAPVLS
jgi:signal transduction histidine kinase